MATETVGGRLWVGVALALAVVGPAAAAPSFDGQGRITAVDPDRGTVTIQHGGIAGLLPASRSEFPVQNAALIQSARPGDRVRFTLGAGDESHGLLTVQSLTPEGLGGAGWLDRLLASASAALAILALGAVAAVSVLLWRELRTLNQRVLALDHEVALLRGHAADTQDGVHQITRALDDAATVLRVGYVQELRRRLAPGGLSTAAEPATDPGSSEAGGALVVVQRGRGDLYRAVERGAAGPGLAVIWDRRRSDRRRTARRPAGHERRRTERRSAPGETWTRLGFQLVPGGAGEAVRAPRVLRPVSAERGTPR
jgi:Cu/Ag efflux protein CusF